VDPHGFALFTAASVACGLAPTPVPVAVRVVRADGAAMLQASSVALVTTSAPAGRRCRPARRPWA
jgi:MFS family permease